MNPHFFTAPFRLFIGAEADSNRHAFRALDFESSASANSATSASVMDITTKIFYHGF